MLPLWASSCSSKTTRRLTIGTHSLEMFSYIVVKVICIFNHIFSQQPQQQDREVEASAGLPCAFLS